MATMPQLGVRRTPESRRAIASADLSAEGRAIEGFGNTMQKAGEEMMARQRQEEDAQAVFGARRKLDDWERANLYDPQNGAVAKLGRDAFDLPSTVPKSFDDFAGKLSEGLTTPKQRMAVQEMIASRRDQALTFVDRHSLQQRQVFEEGQFKADIDSSLNRSALLVDAGDVATAQAETKLAQTRAVGFLKARGRSEEEIAAEMRNISSRAGIATINVLLEKDKPVEADAFLKANAGSMKTEDLLRAQSAVGKAMDARQGLVVAQSVADKYLKPALEPSNLGRMKSLVLPPRETLVAAVKAAESGGRRYGADGELLKGQVTKSGEQAVGEMQVMPATYKNPGYGIKPADLSGTKEQQADEIARVGEEKLDVLVRMFGGDMSKVVAAYNAGEGRVQEAVKRAGDRWLTTLPAETQAYVSKLTKQYDDGGGSPPMPTLAELHNHVRQSIPADQPQRRKIAMDEVTRQYEDQVKAKKQGEDESTARAQQWLANNGGRYSQMPANLRAAVPPKEVDNLMNFGQRVAKGDDVTDPVMFQKMATDDGWLKGLTDAQFYMHTRKLSQADGQQMSLRRGKLLSGEDGSKGPGNLDAAGVNAVLNNRLQQLGMDPTPKDGAAEAQRVGAIRKFVWDSVLQTQASNGKRLSDAELSQHIDKLFAQNVTFQTSFFGFFPSKESQRLLSMKPSDIPSDTRERLKKDFKAAGISEPTDADLLGAYLRLKAPR